MIEVTVYCLAYNHENYIRDALEGFVKQITTFEYQVIVHDDASTDETPNIIKEYANKYPKIIKPIFQSTNQYKYGDLTKKHILPKLQSEFTAVCEGDDYWIDPYKLQKQYDYMKNHKQCSLTFSNGYILNCENSTKRAFIPYSLEDKRFYTSGDKDYNLNNLYELSFVPTASYFMRTNMFKKTYEMCNFRCAAGDLQNRAYLCGLGYCHFMDEYTCVYRENVPNSAMSNWKKENKKLVYDRGKSIFKMLENLDKVTDYEYHDGLLKLMLPHCDSLFVENNILTLITDKRLVKLLKLQNTKVAIKSIIKLLLPKSITYNRGISNE